MSKTTKFNYEGHSISFEFEDGNKMINATEMAKPFGKKVYDFLRLKTTKEYIEVLKEYRSGDSRFVHNVEVLRVIKGGGAARAGMQGTWMDEQLALKFASWLAPRFEMWVYQKIHELLTAGTAELKPKQIPDQELLFYLQKIADNSAEASFIAEQLRQRINDEYKALDE